MGYEESLGKGKWKRRNWWLLLENFYSSLSKASILIKLLMLKISISLSFSRSTTVTKISSDGGGVVKYILLVNQNMWTRVLFYSHHSIHKRVKHSLNSTILFTGLIFRIEKKISQKLSRLFIHPCESSALHLESYSRSEVNLAHRL